MHPAVAAARRLGFASGFADLDGIRMHYVTHGRGRPLLLLHGWPEFWLCWRRVMPLLETEFAMVAPDLRGFGATGKQEAGPSDAVGPEAHATNLLALLDRLGLQRVDLVAHDVGAFAAQALARMVPDRVHGLFFFDCPYPGIGRRWAEPRHLGEVWYQSFNQQPWAAELVGVNRRTVATYIGHFLRHWARREDAFDEDFETWIDVYAMPGNLQGGFDWYRSVAAARLAVMEERARHPGRIDVPTRVLWGRHDPVLKPEWTDRLGEYFTDLSVGFAGNSGHFPHMEEPELAAREIRAFFRELPEP